MNKYINLASRYTYVYITYKSLRLSAQLDRHFRGEEEEEEQEKKGQHQLKLRRTLSHTQPNKRNWN